MSISRRAAILIATAGTALSLVAGCGSGGSPSYSRSPATTAPSAPAGSPAPAGASELQTAQSAGLGAIVTDGNGMTLYRFDQDTAKASASHCDGGCATLWPPVRPIDNAQVTGIDSQLVGTVTRPDGSKQVTLDGWPLYRYARDAKPGDVKGEGVGGIWFVSDPTGGKAVPATGGSPGTGPSPSPTAGTGYGSGY